MRLIFVLSVSLALATAAGAQDRHNWDSLAQLKTGDQVRISLTTGAPVTGAFQSFTPENVTVAGVTTKKEDVRKVERYGQGGGSRGKHAAIGALIGFGGGFAIGAAAGGCNKNQIGPCISRGEFGGIVGAIGAVAGALVGALLPHHNKEVIYVR